ncbi:universal stress protein [Paraburkholderia bannensis]|uniref:universal stress protein n=1 Tax=Paraburkholderia bannensis TaxID=765414 RepID=UPI00047F7764|nr:universal stress protein [Paraburkholderia bannensis]
MSFKDVLVHVDTSEWGRARLRLAANLATRHQARLNALFVREPSIAQQRKLKASELGLVPSRQFVNLRASILDELNAQALELQKYLDDIASEQSIDVAWHDVEGHARTVATQYARYADVSVVGHDPRDHADLPEEYAFAEQVLFSTGRPLLIVSPFASSANNVTLGSNLAIAWNGSPACARTLSAAMPMVEAAERVIVLIVDTGKPSNPDWLPPEAIVRHLRRHSAHVDICALERSSIEISERLQDAALAGGADVLIAGAHGRPTLWEKLIGGVTGGLLNEPRIPLLMCS